MSTVVPGDEWFDRIDHDAVLDAMSDAGLTLTWDWPGMAVIDITPTRTVSTGLHGYEYGSINVLIDGSWQPDSAPAEPDGLVEGEIDPQTIAAAWAKWVEAERNREERM